MKSKSSMKKFAAAVVVASSLGMAPSAWADVFNFSYTFGSGDVVSGSLTGTQNGLYVESISNVSAFFNGIAFIGNPNLYQPYSFMAGCCFVSGGSVMSFDANLNNFYFSDVPPGTTGANNFYMNGTDRDYWYTGDQSPLRYAVVTRFNYQISDVSANSPTYPGANQQYDANRWSLTIANPVAAVPEPETYAMLLAGLGLLGFMGRRRKNSAT